MAQMVNVIIKPTNTSGCSIVNDLSVSGPLPSFLPKVRLPDRRGLLVIIESYLWAGKRIHLSQYHITQKGLLQRPSRDSREKPQPRRYSSNNDVVSTFCSIASHAPITNPGGSGSIRRRFPANRVTARRASLPRRTGKGPSIAKPSRAQPGRWRRLASCIADHAIAKNS